MRTRDTEGTVSFTLRVPRTLLGKAIKAAKAEGTSVAWQVIHAMRERWDKPKRRGR